MFIGFRRSDKDGDLFTFGGIRKGLTNELPPVASFVRVKLSAQRGLLASDKHFFADGTLIDAKATHWCFIYKANDSSTRPEQNLNAYAAEHSKDTHAGTGEADTSLFKIGQKNNSRRYHVRHILAETCNVRFVAVQTPAACDTVESEAAWVVQRRQHSGNSPTIIGANKGSDRMDFGRNDQKLKVTRSAVTKDKYSEVNVRIKRHMDDKTILKAATCDKRPILHEPGGTYAQRRQDELTTFELADRTATQKDQDALPY